MLEKLMRLYVMAMVADVRSPMPHLFGPPGCGKSTMLEQLAQLLSVNLHIINVARLSPLEVEGIQMPVDDNQRVHLIPAAFWSRLKEGDIVLFDEFLRGFPEVYNALLDIFTSRRAGAFVLPKVFIIGASNSTVSYDKALEDRLLHLPVPDPRKSKVAKHTLAQLLVDALGLLPDMAKSMEMAAVLDTEVLPMYEILDTLKQNRTSSPASLKGVSLRNLIGQAQLREVQSQPLRELITMNNHKALSEGKAQYVLLLDGHQVDDRYLAASPKLQGNSKLSPLQAQTLGLNLQLIEMEKIRREKEGVTEDDAVDIDDLFS